MAIRRAYLHWAHFDKRRPCVIVSPDERNELASDVIVVPCSTVHRLGPWHVPLEKGEGGLPQASVAMCEWVTTIAKDDVEPDPLGASLCAERVHEIQRCLLLALGINQAALVEHLRYLENA